jgi:hypothetical protein
MEVHHHAHTPRKKWNHYFWEFLMLFLAVFCGFLAENIREHMVEQRRAKELAQNLYKEALADSIAVQQKLDVRKIKEEKCAYFIKYIKDSSLINLSPEFYPVYTWAFIQIATIMFDPNDGILNQLRNSGELRYFKSRDVQSAIGQLSVQIANVRSRNDREYSYLESYIRPFSLKHYDFDWYEALIDDGRISLTQALNENRMPPFGGKIVNADKFNRAEGISMASYYLMIMRGTRQISYLSYIAANHHLLEVLRKEYHLK